MANFREQLFLTSSTSIKIASTCLRLMKDGEENMK